MTPTESALSDALAQTGFPFENHVFQAVTAQGWKARSSRLYVDGEEQKTREMDLLSYRMTKGKEVTTCTALLISCKHRNQKPWVLLTRRWPDRSQGWPQYPPVPTWSNSDALNCEISRPSWPLVYFNLAEATGLTEWASDSPRDVFALQEFEAVKPQHPNSKNADAPPRFNAKGDSSLYEGAMSLLKALAYESIDVKTRRGASKEQLVYQFNLIQLVDGDLYEANFERSPPEVKKIERYRYFAKTMLGGKEFSGRVEFCTKDALVPLLAELSKLHDYNCDHFNARVGDFYAGVLSTPHRLEALRPEFERRLTNMCGLFEHSEEKRPGWVRLSHEHGKPLKVMLMVDEDVVERLVARRGFLDFVKGLAKRIYR